MAGNTPARSLTCGLDASDNYYGEVWSMHSMTRSVADVRSKLRSAVPRLPVRDDGRAAVTAACVLPVGGPEAPHDHTVDIVLPHYLRSLGVDCVRVLRCADDTSSIREAIRSASDVDLVCVVGAIDSPDDCVRPALGQLGASTVVDGVRCDPGGTQIVAQLFAGPIVHCLPAEPFAVTAAVFVVTAAIVDALTATSSVIPSFTTVPHAFSVVDAVRVLPATRIGDGSWHVEDADGADSHGGLIDRDAIALVSPSSDAGVALVELIELPR
jgi:molybdopterin molybdotransferase